MFKNKIQLLIFIFLILISFQNIHAQLSKKHYLPPITSDDPIENQYIYISTPKNQNIGFKIIPIGQPETSIVIGTVSNTTSYETSSAAIGTQLFQSSNSTSVITSNKGYIIEADDVIYVSVRMRSLNGFQAGAIVSKGISALGTNFRMGGFSNNSPANGHLNFISVMATEDDTNVNFDDISAGITINNYTQIGITPINITLDEGETYIVSVSVDGDGDPNDLIGTLVNSDKPIVVNSGSATGSFADGNGRDYGVDQIVDASKVGTEYIFVRGDGNDEWENALIVAHEDNTEIKVAGNIIQTLNKGEFHVIEGGFYNFNGNMFVETSKPAFAYQGIGGLNGGAPSQANQGMFFVPPLSCENRGDVNNIAKIDAIGGDTFQGGITIVTNKDADVTINGLPIANFNNSGPFDVNGNPNYETYRVSNLTGNVTVKSSEELYCAYFNYDGFATSGSFYSGFPSAPEINFTSNIQSLGDCVPNLTLDAANTDLFDSFDWLFDDETGTGFISIGITTSNFSPTLPGKYKLVGFISCSGLTFESAEVPVSLCPDDFDGDAIIDNLDVDIDNDGILNCD
ncbi:MAG: IgGFc-binding protein, partial [Flavobacteriales bacterium]